MMTVDYAVAPPFAAESFAPARDDYPRPGASLPDVGAPMLHRVCADDVDTATGALSEVYSEVSVRLARTAPDLHVEVASRRLADMTLGTLSISSSTVLSSCYPYVAVCLPISGRIRITNNRRSAWVNAQSGVVVSAGSPVVVDYLSDDCRMESLLFERTAVEAELANMLGAPLNTPLRFELDFALSATSPFSRALSLLYAELKDPSGLASHPALSSRLGRLLIAGLLVSQPNNYTAEMTKPRQLPASRPIRNAVDYIGSHSSEIETVADIATAVGLSVRALDDGFQRYVGTPPMAYLRLVRLTRAHDELVEADPDDATVTTVARKWGFGHYGRFAADYQRRFGCKPSETLRSRGTPIGLGV
jgi:AraC-like DNA-binding protein